VDQNIAQVVHLAPGNSGMCRPEVRAHLPGGLTDDFQIPADRVEKNGNRNATLFAQTIALNQFFAAIPNMQQIDPWIG
jgi:hypothetical protein